MAADEITAAPDMIPDEDSAAVGWWSTVKFALVRAFLWGWARCFSLKGLYLFGQFFGTCEYLINYKRRRRFMQRLVMIYEGRINACDARRHTRAHFMRVRCDKLFYLIFDRLPREKILKRVRLINRDILDNALAGGRGAYLALSHCGSHHVAGLLMALLGYRIWAIRDRNEGELRKYVQDKYAETFPEFRAIRVLYADAYPRDLYRAFKENCILASALDVDRNRGSHLRTLPVQMFGQERQFITGTMQVALRCKAPILQGFVVSRPNFYFRMEALGPLTDAATARDDPDTLQTALQRYADNIAAHLREHPDHVSKT